MWQITWEQTWNNCCELILKSLLAIYAVQKKVIHLACPLSRTFTKFMSLLPCLTCLLCTVSVLFCWVIFTRFVNSILGSKVCWCTCAVKCWQRRPSCDLHANGSSGIWNKQKVMVHHVLIISASLRVKINLITQWLYAHLMKRRRECVSELSRIVVGP